MISMTGFGRAGFALGQRTFRIELRSVNNRFLDVKIRLPWIDGELEARTLALVRRSVARGRVDVSVLEERSDAAGALRLDGEAARNLAAALRELCAVAQCDLPTAAALLQQSRVELLSAGGAARATDETWPQLEPGLRQALDALIAMRRREGAALAAALVAQLDELGRRLEEIQRLVAGEPERQRARLEGRLAALHVEGVDPARLAMEVAICADRADVSEELARLASHIDQLRGAVDAEGEVGRKLEFMLQEVHRELNTIASKTVTAEVAHHVVEAKAAVEKMREQAQNVE
jgi:uncharacterized protein (TIGR00255 family)